MAIDPPRRIEPPGPPPRRVRLKSDGFRVGMGCLWLFLVPFVIVGVIVPGMVLKRLYLTFGAPATSGKVVARSDDGDSDEDNYRVEYTYTVAKNSYRHWESVPFDAYADLEVGAPVLVQYAPLLPGMVAGVALPARSRLWNLGFWAPFALFWDAIVSIFLYLLVVLPLRARWLHCHGKAGVARIVRKEVSKRDDSTSYFLCYDFTPESMRPAAVSDKIAVELAEWNTVQIGDETTILYDPSRPHRRLLYPYGGFEILS